MANRAREISVNIEKLILGMPKLVKIPFMTIMASEMLFARNKIQAKLTNINVMAQ